MLTALSACSAPGTQTPASSAEPSSVQSEPVPAPGGGNVNETIAPGEAGVSVTAALDTPAVLPSGITVSLSRVRRADVPANTPGEIAGPAVIADVRISNGSSSALDLGSAVVNLIDESGTPGRATTAGPADPFTDVLQPGGSLDGVYVFGVPAGAISPIQISVSYAGGAPTALFSGDVS